MTLPLFKKNHIILLCCIVASLPFSIDHLNITGFFIIVYTVNALILSYLTKPEIDAKKIKMTLLFISVYLIHIIGIIYSSNKHEGFFVLEKKLSLLIFPISFLYTPILNQKEIKLILLCFILSCFATISYCIIVALYTFMLHGDSSVFFYHKLSGLVGMHAGYLSIYLTFSIAILVFTDFQNKWLSNKFLYYCMLLVLLSSTILLSSRTQIAFLILATLAFTIYKLMKKNNLFISILKIIAIISFISIATLILPSVRERFKSAINYNNEYALDKKWGEGQMRYLMWHSAIELIKNNPIIGVGTGDVQDELQKNYINNKFHSLTFFKDTRFNAHNQFLETSIALGIIGILLFLISILLPFMLAWKEKNILYCIFLIQFSVSCMTESVLERQSGVVYFAIFNSFFLFNTIYFPTQKTLSKN